MLISLKNTSWLFAVLTAGTGPTLQQPQNAESFPPNRRARMGGFCQTASSSHPMAAKHCSKTHKGSPLALLRRGAVPLLPPTPAAETRLLSQDKHHPVKTGTNLNSIKDTITPMHITTQSINYSINGA